MINPQPPSFSPSCRRLATVWWNGSSVSAVSRPEKDGLPGYRQSTHGFVERRDLIGAIDRRNGETATDHIDVVSVHRYAISLRCTRERLQRPDMASAVRRSEF